VISPDEARRPLGVADSLGTRLLLSLAYGCGLRAGGGLGRFNLASSIMGSEEAAAGGRPPTQHAARAVPPFPAIRRHAEVSY